jgi:CDP-paratose synthetase
LNIFLTGATGFVGSHILSKLLHCGHNVTIIRRPNSDTKRIDDYIDQVSTIDNENNINGTLGFDCIIHAATSYENSNYAGSDILSANINLPVYLLDYAVNNKCKKFINISTFIAKYEAGPPNSYALTKRHMEEWGMYYCNHYPLNFVNVVLHQVYGTGDSITKFTPWLVNELKTNVKSIELTEGNQERDFVNVIDVQKAIGLIVEQPYQDSYDEYEVCSGNITTIREFAQIVKLAANSCSRLDFGAIDYRENEIMSIHSNPSKTFGLGWRPEIELVSGVEIMIRNT